jgi:hypothetical protein
MVRRRRQVAAAPAKKEHPKRRASACHGNDKRSLRFPKITAKDED